MNRSSNGEQPYSPCLVCGQDVKKVHGMDGAEGPLCTRECARAYFIARQIASVRGALMGQQQGQRLVVPKPGGMA